MLSGCYKLPLRKKKVIIPPTITRKNTPTLLNNTPTVTVFVHGTRFFGHLDDAAHCPVGLHHISSLPANYDYHKIASTLETTDPFRFPQEHFYTFGWSGKLSFDDREQAGKELYQALGTLRTQYEEKYHHAPEFRLLSHSHGGNVVLNLAKVKDTNKPLTIAQAILMACPVQHETEHLTKSPVFKQIHSIYSVVDGPQVLDPQGLYKTPLNPQPHLEFSRRRFPGCSKLTQSRINLNTRSPLHHEFIRPHFLKFLPTIIDELDCIKATHYIDSNNNELLLSLIARQQKK